LRIALIGVGLIGGSVGMAARHRLGAEVAGFDPAPGVLAEAGARGAVDEACESVAEALAGAEIAIVAVPVDALVVTIREVLALAGADCAVSDVGSVKRAVVGSALDPRFVGGHPLAGAETAGVRYARDDLFSGATWYLTPTARTSGILYERLARAVAGLGATPTAIDADRHDRLMAHVSHLPHVLANVVVSGAARAVEDAGLRLPATGPSFRDATRVAGSNSAIWTGIYMANRDALTTAIDDTIDRLLDVRDLLRDPAGVEAWNDQAGEDRRRLLEADLAGGPVHELRIPVPNRPGVIAELALALGRGGVNIADMALYPAPDFSEGLVALWVAGDEPAARAQELLGELGFAVARA
jgi:prephenate dehydrogenase